MEDYSKKIKYNSLEMPIITRGLANDSTELIGNTPMVRLNRLTRHFVRDRVWHSLLTVTIQKDW